MKTENDLRKEGFILLYVAMGDNNIWGKDKERYCCKDGIAQYKYYSERGV